MPAQRRHAITTNAPHIDPINKVSDSEGLTDLTGWFVGVSIIDGVPYSPLAVRWSITEKRLVNSYLNIPNTIFPLKSFKTYI